MKIKLYFFSGGEVCAQGTLGINFYIFGISFPIYTALLVMSMSLYLHDCVCVCAHVCVSVLYKYSFGSKSTYISLKKS